MKTTQTAANDSGAAPTPAERLARSNKCAFDIVEGMTMQFWALTMAFNLYLAVIGTTLYPKPETRNSK